MAACHSLDRLDRQVVHEICTNQVVVTLQACVKELVENALDAGATRVEVRLRESGAELLEVIDNGHGVSPQDYERLAMRHATSKIREFEDLSKTLNTFGFRGEALAAICAMGEMTVCTRTAADAAATLLVYDRFGRLETRSPAAREVGTTVSVRELFRRIPVRHREFIRNAKAQVGAVLRLIQACAVAQPEIRFHIVAEKGRGPGAARATLLSTSGAARGWHSAAAAVFGDAAVSDLQALELSSEETGWAVSGLISPPHGGRRSRDMQLFFVNRRPIDPPKRVIKLINDTFHQYNSRMWPSVILSFCAAQQLVDVNVTPDKRTVFLHNEEGLLSDLQKGLTELYGLVGRGPGGVLVAELGKSTSTRKGPGNSTGSRNDPQPLPAPRNELSALAAGGSQACMGEAHTPGPASARHSVEESPEKMSAPWADTQSTSTGSRISVEESSIESAVPSFQIVEMVAPGAAEPLPTPEPMGADVPRLVASHLEQGAAGGVDEEILPGFRVEAFGSPSLPAVGSQGADSGAAGGVDEDILPGFRVETFGSPTLPAVDTHGADAGAAEPSSLTPRRFGRALQKRPSEATTPPPALAFQIVELDEPGGPPAQAGGEANTLVSADAPQQAVVPHNQVRVEEPEVDSAVDVWQPEGASVVASVTLAELEASVARRRRVKEASLAARRALAAESGIEATQLDSQNPSDVYFPGAFSLSSLAAARGEGPGPAAGAVSLEDVAKFHTGGVLQQEPSSSSFRFDQECFSKMRVIGQFNLGFIIAALRTQAQKLHLFIVDQHASDEKFRFEALNRQSKIDRQPLVSPHYLELTPAQEQLADSHSEIFRLNGFELGRDDARAPGRRLRLATLPTCQGMVFGERDIHELLFTLEEAESERSQPSAANAARQAGLLDLAGHRGLWTSSGTPRPPKVWQLLACRACRGAIMIGKALRMPEMEKVLANLGTLQQPWNCPHGRPTMRHLADTSTARTSPGKRPPLEALLHEAMHKPLEA